jgi:NDP-sugar pyrophosphorylase family protein
VTVLKALSNKLSSDFIVMNGYTITDVPLDEIIDSHRL